MLIDLNDILSAVGLIASFPQVLTTPEKPPIEMGIEWFDTIFLATKSSPVACIYCLSILILVAIWLRSLLNYLGLDYFRLSQSNLCGRLRRRLFEQLQSLRKSEFELLVDCFTVYPADYLFATDSRSKDLFN